MTFFGKVWHKNDLISLCSQVTGMCGFLIAIILGTVQGVQAQLHPGAPPTIPAFWIILTAVIGAIGSIAQQVVRIISVPSAPAGQSYVVTNSLQTPPPHDSLAPVHKAEGGA